MLLSCLNRYPRAALSSITEPVYAVERERAIPMKPERSNRWGIGALQERLVSLVAVEVE